MYGVEGSTGVLGDLLQVITRFRYTHEVLLVACCLLLVPTMSYAMP